MRRSASQRPPRRRNRNAAKAECTQDPEGRAALSSPPVCASEQQPFESAEGRFRSDCPLGSAVGVTSGLLSGHALYKQMRREQAASRIHPFRGGAYIMARASSPRGSRSAQRTGQVRKRRERQIERATNTNRIKATNRTGDDVLRGRKRAHRRAGRRIA